MQTRYMERSSSMAAREKRLLDPSSSQEAQPDRKRPALASVIVEALKLDSLQKLCSSLEPILRRVVSEEVERALAKLGPARLNGRVSPKRIEGPDGRNLQLHFKSKLSLPLFTGGKIEGEQGAAIHIVLVDARSGHVVTSGPESSVKLDVVVLEGDFNNEDDEGWTPEEFGSHMVKEREGKRPLLTGDLQVTLKEGVGTLGELTFTDNSSWIRSRRFRLGLKVASGSCDGVYIREAKTEAFTVKDHRGELYKKHYPPALNDEVWRLEKIGKDGSFHKKLLEAGISTVEHFLRHVMTDPQRLRNILGSGMSNKMWEVLVEHAKTCTLSGKVYIYYSDELENVAVVFNDIYALSGLIADGQYHSIDFLSPGQKIFVDNLVKEAYENWANVREYDGKYLLDFPQNKNSAVSQNDHVNSLQDQPNSFDHLGQLCLQSLPASVPAEHPYTNAGLTLGGHNNDIGSSYTMQSQNTDLNVAIQLDGNSFAFHTTQQAQPSGTQNTLTLCPPQLNTPSLHSVATPNLSIRGYEDITEDDIRIQSHEILENEDMQDMLRMFSMGGHGSSSFNITDNNFTFTPYTPFNLDFQEDRRRSSGKAVVGWLKLKAALRWGIFIRKKAAERRAQIVELF
ncbi:calmodulin-binding protein 60 C-like [Olea europaea var. sylvestris]|uniref:calmodulin-binding protein 60 C-like n=1 Tax=Olea europaea var. sylvestris TaxID=158386 RepID=UPI000C1D6A8A|nr:calmodulin-binding protein 60 C-like [Olea europaea var. sylvestris]